MGDAVSGEGARAMAESKTEPVWKKWHDELRPVRLGVSACLLGAEVRFDGGHKRDRYLTDVLGENVTWVPVCPELEVGLGIPRPVIQLRGGERGDRLVVREGGDLTEAMRATVSSSVDASGISCSSRCPHGPAAGYHSRMLFSSNVNAADFREPWRRSVSSRLMSKKYTKLSDVCASNRAARTPAYD